MAQTFDTLAAAKRMEGAGMARDQAEAVAETVADARGDLVTAGDLETALLRQDRRQLLAGLAVAGLLFAALKLIP